MAILDRWRAFALGVCGSCLLASPARAATEPARIEVTMVGDSLRDPTLFARVRSLFPHETSVVLSMDEALDASAVLKPERADTLYLWIRVSGKTRAQIYLAARETESDRRARYLVDDVQLDAGLDEVGGETLAQVAHSLSEALWHYERQTPKPEVVAALERETPSPAEEEKAPPPSAPASSPEAHDCAGCDPQIWEEPRDSGVTTIETPGRRSPPRLGLFFGASDTLHAAGVEGWLQEPGAFLGAEFRERFSLRLTASYLVPAKFDVSPVQLQLTGGVGELRAGWLPGKALGGRVRLEAGVGVLFARWSASLVNEHPGATASEPQSFTRSYALGSAALEWPLGPLRIGARFELRVPFQRTSYDVAGSDTTAVSSALSPGGGLELGFLLDPAARPRSAERTRAVRSD